MNTFSYILVLPESTGPFSDNLRGARIWKTKTKQTNKKKQQWKKA